MLQNSNSNRVMEPETISKNGASLKSHTSRGNKSLLFGVGIALVAGIVAFSACKKDDSNPTADGVRAAQEACDCLKKSGASAITTCIEEVDAKYKWFDSEAEVKEFEAAFTKEFLNCVLTGNE